MNVILFQRIDLRDNCIKVAGLMALDLSMKVNTSITQLDLDSVPKKKMVCITFVHCSLTWITKLVFVSLNPVVYLESSVYMEHIFKILLFNFTNPSVWGFSITHFNSTVCTWMQNDSNLRQPPEKTHLPKEIYPNLRRPPQK